MSGLGRIVRRVLRAPRRLVRRMTADRMAASSALGAIRARRSIREFSEKPVPERDLRAILEAARLAPHGGPVNWKMGVIRDQKVKDALAEHVVQDELIRQVPVIVACCTECKPYEEEREVVHRKLRRRHGEEAYQLLLSLPSRIRDSLYQDQNLIIAGENLVIAARSLGLGTCWVGAISIDGVGRALGLPENWMCLYLILVGYPRQWPKERTKRPFEEIVFHDRYS